MFPLREIRLAGRSLANLYGVSETTTGGTSAQFTFRVVTETTPDLLSESRPPNAWPPDTTDKRILRGQMRLRPLPVTRLAPTLPLARLPGLVAALVIGIGAVPCYV